MGTGADFFKPFQGPHVRRSIIQFHDYEKHQQVIRIDFSGGVGYIL